MESTQGLPTKWNLVGTLAQSDISDAGTGTISLAGTVTTSKSVLNASLSISFSRSGNQWIFSNLPLIIHSGNDNDFSGSSWGTMSTYAAGWFDSYYGYWMSCSGLGNDILNCIGTYSVGGHGCRFGGDLTPLGCGGFATGGGGYSFSLGTNTEIPVTYEDGVLVNFPIGTKQCSWNCSGNLYGECCTYPGTSLEWDCVYSWDGNGGNISGGGNGFCKLTIKR